ncbi:MAG: GNAT family N-acetyltransferase [Ktedonobacteraceae bacterium]
MDRARQAYSHEQERLRQEPFAEWHRGLQAHHQRLGIELLRRLIQFGRAEQFQRITGDILMENQRMQAVCRKLGFRLRYAPEDQLMKAEIDL